MSSGKKIQAVDELGHFLKAYFVCRHVFENFTLTFDNFIGKMATHCLVNKVRPLSSQIKGTGAKCSKLPGCYAGVTSFRFTC